MKKNDPNVVRSSRSATERFRSTLLLVQGIALLGAGIGAGIWNDNGGYADSVAALGTP